MHVGFDRDSIIHDLCGKSLYQPFLPNCCILEHGDTEKFFFMAPKEHKHNAR